MIIKLLHAFKHVNIPSFNEYAKKLLNKLDIHYIKIHVFPNIVCYIGESMKIKINARHAKDLDGSKRIMNDSEHDLIN